MRRGLIVATVLSVACMGLYAFRQSENEQVMPVKYQYSGSGPMRLHVVGDFGELRKDYKLADDTWAVEHVAAKMKAVAKERPIDMVITAGDNRYNKVDGPDDDKIRMLVEEIFDDGSIAGKPWYLTLGNHDCINPIEYEIQNTQLYTLWNLPAPFYKKTIEIDNGKKVAFLFLNGCDLGCEDYKDHKHATDMCEELDKIASQSVIDAQYKWLTNALIEYHNDSSVAWIVASIHMPPYTSGTGDGDMEVLKKRLVPLLMDYEVDLLITGHVHLMEHYFLDNESMNQSLSLEGVDKSKCMDNYYAGSSHFSSPKGKGLHQMVIGASGRKLDELCIDDSFGASKLLFADSQYGFTELYIDSKEINISYLVADKSESVFEVNIYEERHAQESEKTVFQ